MNSGVEQTSKLPVTLKLALRIQKFISWLLLPVWYLLSVLVMRFVLGYRVLGLSTFRQKIRQLIHAQERPIIICANHLTKIDSLIILWAMGSLNFYFWHFKKFSCF